MEELKKKNWNIKQVENVKGFLSKILIIENLFSGISAVGEPVAFPISKILANIDSKMALDFRNDVGFIRLEILAEEAGQKGEFIRLSSNSIQILRMFSLVFELMPQNMQVEDFKLVLSKKEYFDPVHSKSSLDNIISFWCLNPSIMFNQLSEKCRSVILASGTLSPLNTFSGVNNYS